MTDIFKRSLFRAAALGMVAAALMVGCGKKEEPKPAPVVEAPKPEPLKIAFAYVGPVGDGGWTFAHDNARKALEAEFGDKIKTSFIENVSESADAERNFRDMVAQGNKLIFGTTFGYMEPMLKVATDHKDVKFEHATGFKQADNMRTYDSRTYEGAYMAGVIAGKMTKSNTLAWWLPYLFLKWFAISTPSPWARNRSTLKSRPKWYGSTSGSTHLKKPKPLHPSSTVALMCCSKTPIPPQCLKPLKKKASAHLVGTRT